MSRYAARWGSREKRACASASARSGWCRTRWRCTAAWPCTRRSTYRSGSRTAHGPSGRSWWFMNGKDGSRTALPPDGDDRGSAPRMVARAVVERDGRAVGREGHSAGDAAGWEPVRVDERHGAQVGGGPGVEHAKLVAVDDEGDPAAVLRPRNLTRLFRRSAEHLCHRRVLHVLADPQRLTQPGRAARLEDVRHGIARGRGRREHGTPGAEEPSPGERRGHGHEPSDH